MFGRKKVEKSAIPVFEVRFKCQNCSCEWTDIFPKGILIKNNIVLEGSNEIEYSCPNCERHFFKVLERKMYNSKRNNYTDERRLS